MYSYVFYFLSAEEIGNIIRLRDIGNVMQID